MGPEETGNVAFSFLQKTLTFILPSYVNFTVFTHY